jgi:WD domain, G-beta repeat
MCKRLPLGLSAVVLLALARSAAGDSACVSPKLIVRKPACAAFPGRPCFVGFDARGAGVLVAGWGKVHHWAWPRLDKFTNWESDDPSISWRSFAFDGKAFAEFPSDHVLRVWNARDGKLSAQSLGGGADTAIRPQVLLSPTCVLGCNEGKLYVGQIKGGAAEPAWRALERAERDSGKWPFAWAASEDGRCIAAWSARPSADETAVSPALAKSACDLHESVLCLWDAHAGKLLKRHLLPEFRNPKPTPRHDNGRIVFAPGAQSLLLSVASTLRIVEAASGKALRQFRLPEPPACRPVFSPDGGLLAAATAGQVFVWHVPTALMLATIPCPAPAQPPADPAILCLAFSPDGRTLAVGRDKEILFFPVALQDDGAPDDLWERLNGDAADAFQAMRHLELIPSATHTLRARLKPISAADPAALKRLVENLEAPRYALRRDASKALADMGELATGALLARLDEKPSLEGKRRIEELLRRLAEPQGFAPWLRELRAIEVLEHINTPLARKTLAELADGAAGHRVTEHARAALARLTPKDAPARLHEAGTGADKPPRAVALARLGSPRPHHDGRISFIQYSRSGKTLVTADAHEICLWDSAGGERKTRVRLEASTRLTANGESVLLRGARGVSLMDMDTGKTRVPSWPSSANLKTWPSGRRGPISPPMAGAWASPGATPWVFASRACGRQCRAATFAM